MTSGTVTEVNKKPKKRVIMLANGKTRKYSNATVDWKVVISKVKEIYETNFRANGVTQVTIRNLHYALMDYPELKLGELEDRYSALSKALVKSRDGEYGEVYRLPEHWFTDMKRREAEPRPWRTPQQFAQDLLGKIDYEIEHYPQPKFFRQDKYYIELWVEKDTMQRLLEQLVSRVIGKGLIPVVPVSGFDGRSHLHDHFVRLVKQVFMGRRVVIFYLGDYDPSGLDIERDFRDRLMRLGLYNFEVKRIGVTLQQIRELGLHEVVDPDKLKKLREDPRGAAFERMPGHNGRSFAVEVDSFSKPEGMQELKRIMREEMLTPPYWDKKVWKKYENIFITDKVRKRVVAQIADYIKEKAGTDSVDDYLADLKTEREELLEIEGVDNYKVPIDEDEDWRYGGKMLQEVEMFRILCSKDSDVTDEKVREMAREQLEEEEENKGKEEEEDEEDEEEK
jgi:hypothetical protein